MYSKSVQKLIDIFSKFPTIGPKTAARFVFYLIEMGEEKADEIINSISELKKNIKILIYSGDPFSIQQDIR